MKATDFWRKEADKMRNTSNITDTSKVLDTKTVTEDKAPIENNEYPARGVTIVYSHRGRYLDTIIDENADYPNEVHFIEIDILEEAQKVNSDNKTPKNFEYEMLKLNSQIIRIDDFATYIRAESKFYMDNLSVLELRNFFLQYSDDPKVANEECGLLYTLSTGTNFLKRLYVEWNKEVEKKVEKDKGEVIGSSILNPFNPINYKKGGRVYRMTWHTHPTLIKEEGLQDYRHPSGSWTKEGNKGDIAVLENMYHTNVTNKGSLLFMRYLLGGPGIIVHKEGITFYRHNGPYLNGHDAYGTPIDKVSYTHKLRPEDNIADGVPFLILSYNFWGL